MSKKAHNSMFEYRQIRWCDKYEYYLNEERGHFVMIRLTNLFARVLLTTYYPVIVLLEGIVNYKQVNKEIGDMWYQRERGRFSGDDSYRSQDGWDELMSIVKKC